MAALFTASMGPLRTRCSFRHGLCCLPSRPARTTATLPNLVTQSVPAFPMEPSPCQSAQNWRAEASLWTGLRLQGPPCTGGPIPATETPDLSLHHPLRAHGATFPCLQHLSLCTHDVANWWKRPHFQPVLALNIPSSVIISSFSLKVRTWDSSFHLYQHLEAVLRLVRGLISVLLYLRKQGGPGRKKRNGGD